ncbi:MarR family transcriptional regulator [Streptomyces sp. NPDC088194]|uniref:MarR family winged helix-turn-helix transcriptional regulator n=1 Tax=Streptomyces sp. NPDC088194 TaxID=3154931 RepID=UPI00344D4CF6
MDPRTTATAEESAAGQASRPADSEAAAPDSGQVAAAAGQARDEAAARALASGADEVTGRLADQLLTLSRRLHRSQRRLMEPLGITPAQSRLLRTLAHCEAPPRMADLAQRLDVVPRAVTTLVDALEELELVRRVPDPHNRRVIRIELREDGARALSALRGARRAAAAELLAPLDGEQRAALSALLDVLGEGEPSGHGHRHGHERGHGRQ